MKTRRKPKVIVHGNGPRKGARQAPPTAPRRFTDFRGIISREEAEKMIRDIEEAFEQVDAD